MSKKNIVILLLTVIVFILLFLPDLETGSKVKIFPKLEKEFDTIELNQDGEKVILFLKDEKWMLDGDRIRKGDKTIIDPIVNFFKKDLTGELVSSAKVYEKYGLDENQNKIFTFYQKDTRDKPVATYIIGNQANRNNSFYFLGDDGAVYQVEGDLFVLDKKKEDFIDKQIYQANPNQIEELLIAHQGQEIELTKTKVKEEIKEEQKKDSPGGEENLPTTNPEVTRWLDRNKKEYSENKINDIINVISSLKAEKFLDDTKKSDYNEKIYEFKLIVNNKEPISLVVLGEEDESFIAATDSSEDVFLLTKGDTERLKIKNFSLLE